MKITTLTDEEKNILKQVYSEHSIVMCFELQNLTGKLVMLQQPPLNGFGSAVFFVNIQQGSSVCLCPSEVL